MKRSLMMNMLLLAGMVGVISCGQKDRRTADLPARSDKPISNALKRNAPDFVLTDSKGNPVRLSDFSGKVIILDFWATWCGPCRLEIPGFVKLNKKYREDGLTVLGVSLDQGGWRDVLPFMKSYGMNYPVVLGTPEVVLNYGGIEAIPTTFIIDRAGNIVEKVVGYRPDEYFESRVKQLLKAEG